MCVCVRLVCVCLFALLSLTCAAKLTQGLKKNVVVGIRFIEAWLNGSGNVAVDGVVEDSATAEISRSQVRCVAPPITSLSRSLSVTCV